MSEELAKLTDGFDHSPDRLMPERAREARRELRHSEIVNDTTDTS